MSLNRIIIQWVHVAALITLAMLMIGYSLVTIRKRFSLIFNMLIRLFYVPVILRALYPFTSQYNSLRCGTMRGQYVFFSVLLAVAFLPMCIAVLIRREYRIAVGLISCALLPLLSMYVLHPVVLMIFSGFGR